MKQEIASILTVILALLAIVVVSGCTSPGITPSNVSVVTVQADTGLKSGLAANSDYSILITGGNTTPVTVTYADMMAMDFVEKDQVVMVKSNGVTVTSDFIGVPMTDLLAKAGVPDGNITFKVSAPDGYVMMYSGEDLENGVLGFKRNGTALTNDVNVNPIQLVEPGKTGNQWIKVPIKIEIEKA
jgi:DMSO/TMAO reductase YedYZ molybdopterin-dependent catalytic subunit